MRVRSAFSVTLTLALSLLACGRARDTHVNPLSTETKKSVEQNLKNGRIPAPAEVAADVLLAEDSCKAFRAKLPLDWVQGTVNVPENPAQPDGPHINVFYYGKLKPNSTPVVFFNGGPSADSHSSLPVISRADKFFDPRAQLSFIYIDQRGTGCSSAYPQGSTPDILKRLANYGTRGIVADAEAVRKLLLKDQPWIVFGQSYGGYIVHRYATIAPSGVKAAFSHANVISPDGYARVRERISAQVRVSEIYLAQYPDDRALLKVLKTQLLPTKCFVSTLDPTEKACGVAPLFEITASLLGFTTEWGSIHEWIGIMATPQGLSDDGVARFLAAFYFKSPKQKSIGFVRSSVWAGKVIEWVDRTLPHLDTPTCSRVRTDLKLANIDLDASPLNECLTSLQLLDANKGVPAADALKAVEILPQDPLRITDFVAALKANPALPFYVYSGQKDAYVPVGNFAPEVTAAQGLPNFHYVNFLGTGHDGFYTEARVWQDLVGQGSSAK